MLAWTKHRTALSALHAHFATSWRHRFDSSRERGKQSVKGTSIVVHPRRPQATFGTKSSRRWRHTQSIVWIWNPKTCRWGITSPVCRSVSFNGVSLVVLAIFIFEGSKRFLVERARLSATLFHLKLTRHLPEWRFASVYPLPPPHL